jgi:hypothetical protein
MKKRLAFAGILLLAVTGFTACKKQNEETKPLKTKMIGKWKVEKIETQSGNSAKVTTNYTTANYMDFKDNESDDFELSLGASDRYIGSYAVALDNSFYLNFSERDLDCSVSTITSNKFVFTGKVVGSNPLVTQTYYLSR